MASGGRAVRAVAVALVGAGFVMSAWASAASAEPEPATSTPSTTSTAPVDVTAPVGGDGTSVGLGSDPVTTTTTTTGDPLDAGDVEASAGPPVGAVAGRPADEDLGDYGPTPPPDELADPDVAAAGTASSAASPSLAGTGRGSGRLARMALILGLGGVLLVVADRSDRSRATLAWAYRSASRRSRERDDLLPGARSTPRRHRAAPRAGRRRAS